jgi:hypothetical protein
MEIGWPQAQEPQEEDPASMSHHPLVDGTWRGKWWMS